MGKIGRSGAGIWRNMLRKMGLSENDVEIGDYKDAREYFEHYYFAGRNNKDMPRITMHPEDAHATYNAGRKDGGF